MWVVCAADEDIASSFDECFEFIDEGRRAGGVLVFCTAGVSRSATIVMAYLMQLHKWTYSRAFEETQAARRCASVQARRSRHRGSMAHVPLCRGHRRWIKPNRGFIAQLMVR